MAGLDALQQDPARWIGVISALGARYSSAPAVPAGQGTALVALLGRELVLKLHPPFLRDHFAFEHALPQHLQDRLSVPTPRLLDSAERAGWPYLVIPRSPRYARDVTRRQCARKQQRIPSSRRGSA